MKFNNRLISVSLILTLLLIVSSCIERKPQKSIQKESPVTAELKMLIDQRTAIADSLSQDQIDSMFLEHRKVVYQYMVKALIKDPVDLYRAAVLLQTPNNGNNETCLQAHYLAKSSAEKGYQPARLLAASLLDRYLIFENGTQMYGTQRHMGADSLWSLYPVDSTVTDSMRSEWDVPSLDSLNAEITAKNQHLSVEKN